MRIVYRPKRVALGALLATATSLTSMSFSTSASAQAFTPDTIVSVCSGVSLPPSVVTGILAPVVTGIVAPIETTTNSILTALTLGLVPGLPGPLSTNAAGLLAAAAAGDDISLAVVAQDGTLVGPSDECNASADAIILDTPAGIALGGNAITGLGNGLQANAGEINSIAVGNGAATNAAALGSVAIGTNASVGAGGIGSVALGNGSSATAANSVALGAGSVAARANTVSVGAPGAERQITNVAPGTVGTDAVNLNQLNAVAALIPDDAVQYDDATHTVVTFDGAGGTTLTNVEGGGHRDLDRRGQWFAIVRHQHPGCE